MDNQTLDLKAFMKSLSEEQSESCESDEKQLAVIFDEGWSEANAVRFHRAMLHARRVKPGVTVEGIFEVALYLGLEFIGDEAVFARLNLARENDVIVYGIQRKDAGRTSGSVLMDGATVVKIKPKRGWKKGQVRGV